MLKRKIYDDLLQWKANKDKQCLAVKGARQIGKTFIIEQFARNNYKHYVALNFEKTPSLKAIFDEDLDTDTLVKKITQYVPDAELVPGETLVFFDEVQKCPCACTALKYLTQDGRFDVVATGSMIGINYIEAPFYPVGYVDYLEMHSLDFEEFLWANGVTPTTIAEIKLCFDEKKPVPTDIHEEMLKYFDEYVIVGGMPRVVSDYLMTRNYANVLKTQRALIAGYLDDIAKHAVGAGISKARLCLLSIPKNLSDDFRTVRYGKSKNRGTSVYLTWLHDAGIVNFCHNVAELALPLEGRAMSTNFKVYMRDTGLLISMLEDGANEDILAGKPGTYKGAIYENVVADMFGKAGKKLYFYEQRGKMEVDFLIRDNDILTAVEVKASNQKARSLTTLIEKHRIKQGMQLSRKNVSQLDFYYNFPFYMAMFL